MKHPSRCREHASIIHRERTCAKAQSPFRSPHDHPRDLRRSNNCGPDNPRPRQESSGQINQALATLFNVASTTEISFGFFPRWWTRAASSAL